MWDTEYRIQLVIDAQNAASAEISKLQWEIKRLQEGFDEMKKQAQEMWETASSAFDWLQNSISTISFIETIRAVKEVWEAVAKVAKEIWDNTVGLASALEPIEQGFKRLSARAGVVYDEMLTGMRKASLWTVSDFNLMTAANKAYSLGVVSNVDQMTTLMEIARVKGAAMWRTMNEALDDIVTGLGRWSAMILDNLWIIVNQTEAQKAYAASVGKTVEQLSDREKKQALINTVVSQGKSELEGLGEATLWFADKQAKLLTTWENLTTLLGGTLLPSIWGVYDKMNAWLDDHIESIEMAVSAVGEIIGNVISTITDAFAEAFSIVWDILHNTVDLFAEGVNNIVWYNLEWTTALKGDWSDFFYFFQQGIAVILWVVQTAIGYIKGLWQGLKNVAGAVVNDLYTIFTGGVDGIKQVFSNMVSDVTNNLKKIANYALKSINWVIDQINKIPWVDIGKLDLFNVDESWAKSSLGKIADLFTEPFIAAKEAGQKALDGMIETYEKRVEKLNKTASSLTVGKTPVDLWGSLDSDKKSGSKDKKDSNLEKLKKEMEDYAKETKKIQQDVYKAVQKEADNWLANQVKNINELDKEFQKSFDKIQDKIDDTTKNIENLTKNISDLRKKLVELQVEQTQSVAKEYVKAKKEMESLEEQYKGLKEVANGVSREDLKGVGGIGKYDVDLIKKYKDYQDEMKSAYTWLSEEERKAMDEQIAYQERYRWLNNVEKIKEDYRIKKEEVQSELDAKISALNLEQETLRSLKKEQQKLQDEWIKRIDEEVLKWKEMSDKKQAFEKQYMEILEINHQKQVDMTNKLVEQWNAVYRAKMRAMSGGGGGSSGSRASGWPVYQGNAYLVGEAWPEMFVPATNGKIVKNSDLWGSGGNISVNVNLWGVSINNGSDEKELTQKITESIVRELVLYKKGIR